MASVSVHQWFPICGILIQLKRPPGYVAFARLPRCCVIVFAWGDLAADTAHECRNTEGSEVPRRRRRSAFAASRRLRSRNASGEVFSSVRGQGERIVPSKEKSRVYPARQIVPGVTKFILNRKEKHALFRKTAYTGGSATCSPVKLTSQNNALRKNSPVASKPRHPCVVPSRKDEAISRRFISK